MDFSWSAEQSELLEQILDFARKELTSDVVALDREAKFDRDGWNKCGEFGIHGLPVPEKYGGLGKDPLTTAYALEALGYACRDNGLLFSLNAHMWTCVMPLVAFGSAEQKKRYLPGLCSGELIGGNAMSEPQAGSDAYKLRTTAREGRQSVHPQRQQDLDTNGPVADVLVVFANVSPDMNPKGVSAFLVEAGTPGFTVTRKIEKMGMRTSPMGELHLRRVRHSGREPPGQGRRGLRAVHPLDGLGARAASLPRPWAPCSACSRNASRYAHERKQFGQPIGNFQLVAQRLVQMKMRLESARATALQGRVAEDHGEVSVHGSGDGQAAHQRKLGPVMPGRHPDSRRERLHDGVRLRA